MASPRTTTDVVGVTGSAFGSGLRGGGARELSTGACGCSEGVSYDPPEPPKSPPKKPPPLCGRCRLKNGKRSSRNCAWAGDVSVTSTVMLPAQSTAAKMTAATRQRESRFLPTIQIALWPRRVGKPVAALALAANRHGLTALKKCQLKGS